MKKLLLLASLCLALSGCGSENVAPKIPEVTPKGIKLETQMFGEEGRNAIAEVAVDLDITAMSETVAYGQISYMMYEFEEYLGQTIKMEGIYQNFHVEDTGESYHYLMMMDETNCCQAALDIRLPPGTPYPEVGAKLLVMGDFNLFSFSFGDYPVIQISSYTVTAEATDQEYVW